MDRLLQKLNLQEGTSRSSAKISGSQVVRRGHCDCLGPATFAAGFADSMAARTLQLGSNLDELAATGRTSCARTAGRRGGWLTVDVFGGRHGSLAAGDVGGIVLRPKSRGNQSRRLSAHPSAGDALPGLDVLPGLLVSNWANASSEGFLASTRARFTGIGAGMTPLTRLGLLSSFP